MTDELKLAVGRTYRAKKPRNCGGLVNDRTILHIGSCSVQYDGPSVARGRKYPTVDREVFLAWADYDCSDELPMAAYADWPVPKKGKEDA